MRMTSRLLWGGSTHLNPPSIPSQPSLHSTQPHQAVKTVKAKIRYSAYSSDVGEAARPVAPKWVVNAAYGIVGIYIVGDISFECYNEKNKNNLEWTDWPVVRKGLHAATFQGIASLAIPTVLIHSAVKYSTRGFAMYAPGMLKFGPSVVGLALIPFMPLFDEPAEHAIDKFFTNYVPPAIYKPKSLNPEWVKFGKKERGGVKAKGD